MLPHSASFTSIITTLNMKLPEGGKQLRKIKILYILTMLVALVFIISACTKSEKLPEENSTDDILINYNEEDFKRIEYFVSRFNEAKSDYFIVIPPIIDGGYWIYDFFTDGKEVNIRIDSTRDSYSNRENHEFSCKGISIINEKSDDGEVRRVLEASGCKGTETIDKFQVLLLEQF